jgi:hypothetical protein
MATATKKAPAKTARVTKKQVTAHRAKTARDNSPQWDGAQEWNEAKFTGHFRNAMSYYRLESSTKDLRLKVIEWMELNGYAKDEINTFRKLKDSRLNSTMCAIAMKKILPATTADGKDLEGQACCFSGLGNRWGSAT